MRSSRWCVAAKKAGVKRFIFASSSSVYGVSDQPNVTEEHPLVPLTLYNKYKGMCEPLLFKHTDKSFVGVVFRPATVCGYAPRQRFDLSVNILTNHAINNGKITVFGGEQLRPNLHILDYCDAVQLLLDAPDEKIANEIFNVGYQNMSIMDIALLVKRIVQEEFPEKGEIGIVTTPSDDKRSYHINSDKVRRVLGYAPKRTIEEAVRDLCRAFKRRQAAQFDGGRHVLQRPPHEEAAGRISERNERAYRRRHRRRRLHRQPHGRSVARARLPRAGDRQSGRRPRGQSRPSRQRSRLSFERRDIRQLDAGDALFKDAAFVFHFAGIGDIVPSIERPIDYMDTNVQGTVRVLECARAAKVEKFVYAASSSCYGLGRGADPRGSSDRARVSLRLEQISGRDGGVALAPGLPAAGEFDPHLQCLWSARAHDRRLWRGVRRVSSSKSLPASRSR